MTPDQLLSTMHRQRADLIAMRQALLDLANALEPQTRQTWLQALQSRIATTQAAARTAGQHQDVTAALQASATALEFLHKSLAQGTPGPRADG